ncbi:hypothetical protein [Niallia sp. NCCP-28]|uniref:hypothetical protein n=1 Tax=Niallia sp. NCCP-28 TaxID=2934712 RepID=UPI0020BF46D3|nr:hypothetical protein [Niallia sp. NCCP-28]
MMWGFNLTSSAKAHLGPIVVVTMPSATVNGTAINPPYQAHSEGSLYNFYGSLKNYQTIKGSKKSLGKGDIVSLSWYITGSTLGKTAYRYQTCKVTN